MDDTQRKRSRTQQAQARSKRKDMLRQKWYLQWALEMCSDDCTMAAAEEVTTIELSRQERRRRWAGVIAAKSWDFPLLELPEELQLLVAAHVAAPIDRAALCLAVPPLGCKATKQISTYKGPLMSLGNRLLSGGAVGEAEVRRYVREFAPSDQAAHCLAADYSLAHNEVAQLNTLTAPSVGVRFEVQDFVSTQASWSELEWRLESGALLRCWKTYEGVCNTRPSELAPAMHHYEGEAGAERLVSVACAGSVLGFKGPRGEEKMVRQWIRDTGFVRHFAEREVLQVLRVETPNGYVAFYQGAGYPNRRVRTELPCGEVRHYVGKPGAEHMVRKVLPCGEVWNFKGKRGALEVVSIVRRARTRQGVRA